MAPSKWVEFIAERSRYARIAAAFLCGLVIGGTFTFLVRDYRAPLLERDSEASAVIERSEQVMAYSLPVRLRIPAVSIEAPFEEPLGVDDSGEIEAPRTFTAVGWYRYSPTPGERGPSVILGHVDSYKGPEVFYPLRKLVPGDRIYVDREDGSTATFAVTRLADYPQSGFPTESVYGDTAGAELRLITCSGTYDHGERRYSHNLIVFAARVTE